MAAPKSTDKRNKKASTKKKASGVSSTKKVDAAAKPKELLDWEKKLLAVCNPKGDKALPPSFRDRLTAKLFKSGGKTPLADLMFSTPTDLKIVATKMGYKAEELEKFVEKMDPQLKEMVAELLAPKKPPSAPKKTTKASSLQKSKAGKRVSVPAPKSSTANKKDGAASTKSAVANSKQEPPGEVAPSSTASALPPVEGFKRVRFYARTTEAKPAALGRGYLDDLEEISYEEGTRPCFVSPAKAEERKIPVARCCPLTPFFTPSNRIGYCYVNEYTQEIDYVCAGDTSSKIRCALATGHFAHIYVPDPMGPVLLEYYTNFHAHVDRAYLQDRATVVVPDDLKEYVWVYVGDERYHQFARPNFPTAENAVDGVRRARKSFDEHFATQAGQDIYQPDAYTIDGLTKLLGGYLTSNISSVANPDSYNAKMAEERNTIMRSAKSVKIVADGKLEEDSTEVLYCVPVGNFGRALQISLPTLISVPEEETAVTTIMTGLFAVFGGGEAVRSNVRTFAQLLWKASFDLRRDTITFNPGDIERYLALIKAHKAPKMILAVDGRMRSFLMVVLNMSWSLDAVISQCHTDIDSSTTPADFLEKWKQVYVYDSVIVHYLINLKGKLSELRGSKMGGQVASLPDQTGTRHPIAVAAATFVGYSFGKDAPAAAADSAKTVKAPKVEAPAVKVVEDEESDDEETTAPAHKRGARSQHAKAKRNNNNRLNKKFRQWGNNSQRKKGGFQGGKRKFGGGGGYNNNNKRGGGQKWKENSQQGKKDEEKKFGTKESNPE